MNYNIKGTQLDISDELRSYAERKLATADKFLSGDPTAHANIELQHLPEGRSGKYRAEFTVSASGAVYRAECWGATMHEALDAAGQELQEELSRNKKKKQSVLRRTSVKVKEYLRGWRDTV